MRAFLLLFSAMFFGLNVLSAKNDLDNAMVFKMYHPEHKDTSFVYGTVHIPLKRAIHTVDTVMGLMDSVDFAGFELVLTTSEMLRALEMLKAKDSSESIQYLLSPEQFKVVDKAFENNLTVKLMGINKLKPFGLASLMVNENLEVDTNMAMDILFQKAAKNKGLKIIGLETIEEQLAAINVVPLKKQAEELYKGVVNRKEGLATTDSLVNAYCRMDGKALMRAVDEGIDKNKFFDTEAILENRNKNMVYLIDSIHQTGSLLVGIGSGHLFGKKGVLKLLQKRGYVFEPVLKAEQKAALKEE